MLESDQLEVRTGPWFSIVTACRNDLANLSQTAACLARQSCTDFEWIVVDAASTDGTVAFLDSGPAPNIRYTSDSDSGIYDAFQKGARMAQGRYVVYLGAGDTFTDADTLARVKSFMLGQPDADLYYADSTEEAPNSGRRLRRARNSGTIWWNLFTHHQAMFYARRCFDVVQYDPTYRIAGDYALTARLLHGGASAIHMPFTVANFLLGGASDQKYWLAESECWRARRELGMGLGARSAIWTGHAVIRLGRLYMPWAYRLLRYSNANAPQAHVVERSDVMVDGLKVQAVSIDSAVDAVAKAAARSSARSSSAVSVCTLNLDHVVRRRRDPAFRNAYESARIVLADGFPIALAASLTLWRRVSRVCGSDIIIPLCKRAARDGQSVFLYGASPETLERSATRIKDMIPDLMIAGVASPSANFDPSGPEGEEAIEMIARSGADFIFVALGSGKAEIFSANAARRLSKGCFISIGAGLDFIAGSQKRAPMMARRIGAEWLWRLMHHPRRLGKRYMMSFLVLPSVLLGARRSIDTQGPDRVT